MKRVVIFMDGGVIQNVACDEPTEIFVVDYDIEGADGGHPFLTRLNGDECMLFPIEPEVDEHVGYLVAKTWQIA